MSHASFHAARLRPARTYGAEGDKNFTFVVTSDGEVFKQNEALFSGDKEFFFEYDARTGTTGSIWNVDVKGDAARAIEAKIVGSWDDYEQAKTYADRYVKSKSAASTSAPADPTKPAPAADPFAPPPPPPPAAGGMSTSMLVGLIGGGVVLMGGLLYLASRSTPPPQPAAK